MDWRVDTIIMRIMKAVVPAKKKGERKKRRREFVNLNATFKAGLLGFVQATVQVSSEFGVTCECVLQTAAGRNITCDSTEKVQMTQ